MMSAVIRELTDDDAPGVVALLREVNPTFVVTPQTLVHRRRALPPRARRADWVADEDGRIVATASAEMPWETSEPVGDFRVYVAVDARGRGLGRDLYERAMEHVREAGAERAGSWAPSEEGVAFLERRGFERRRSSWKSALDLASADLAELPALEEQKAREGFRLVALREVLDRPRDLYELDVAASADEPSDYALDSMGYEDWLRTTYEHPGIDRDGSRVVLAGGRLAAWALIGSDGDGRAVNDFTATHPDFRGRGLARLAKLSATAWAREAGARVVYTGNDATNAPMLAINRRLGYERVAELHYLVRAL